MLTEYVIIFIYSFELWAQKWNNENISRAFDKKIGNEWVVNY